MTSDTLLLSYGKSGTVLVGTIVKLIQEQNKLYRSYISQTGITEILKTLCRQFIVNDLEYTIDHIEHDTGSFFLVFHHPQLRRLTVNLPTLSKLSSLIVSHSAPDLLFYERLPFSDRKTIYIYRDGRDVMASWFHFSVQPSVLAKNINFKHRTLSSITRDYDLFACQVQRWASHVKSALSLKERIMLLRFEDVVSNKKATINSLSAHLNLSCDAHAILNCTSLSVMRATAPQHIRKGRRGDWKNIFDSRHASIFADIAGDLLIELGYESDMEWIESFGEKQL